MAASPHYRELLQVLDECGVEYMVVGGYAVMTYTEPRYTKDLDSWVNPTAENSARTYRALARFGAPLSAEKITAETFARNEIIYQIGVAPVRINICTSLSGVAFVEAWPNRVESRVFGLRVPVISLRDLIANKRATGRASDAEDLERLEDEASKTK